MKEIIRPIHDGKNYNEQRQWSRSSGYYTVILWPGAFAWYNGELFVGYSWLSRLHDDEDPVWDPDPVPVGSIIHAHRGYYHFVEVLTAPGRGRNKFAVIRFVHRHREEDMERYENEDATPLTEKDSIVIREQFVLDPRECIRHQRTSYNIKNRIDRNPRALVRRIKTMPSFRHMRDVDLELRKDMETYYPTGFEDEIARIINSNS